MLTIYIFLVFFNFIIGLLSTKKQINRVLSNFLMILTFVFCFILTLNQRNLPDEPGYIAMYNAEISSGIEFGFLFLISIFNGIGIDYFLFRASIILIILLGIVRFCRKMNINKNLILSLYMILPYMFDVIQIRNAIAFAIILFAIPLLKKDKILYYALYVILVILASTIHIMSVCYLIFIFYRIFNPKRFFISFLIVSFLTLMIKYCNPIYDFLTNIMFSGERASKFNYYTDNKLNWGFLLYYLVIVLFSIVYSIVYKGKKSFNIYQKNNIKFLFEINICSLLLMPLIVINIDFYRIFRNLLIINYASLSYVQKNQFYKKNQVISTFSILLFLVSVILNVSISFSGSNGNIFISFFD